MPEENSTNTIDRVQTDPKVACPIMCGGHMGATGFFYSVAGDTYLVTASHNAVPTVAEDLHTGTLNPGIDAENFLPNIDVYLRTSEGFEVKQLDIRERTIRAPHNVDVLAVAVNFDPGEYGYHIWCDDDISPAGESTETLDVIGFDSTAFPDEEYAIEMFRKNIGMPAHLKVVNSRTLMENTPDCGAVSIGFDEQFVGDRRSYNGLSGAPVLGSGLVGIYSFSSKPRSEAVEVYGAEYMQTGYTRAEAVFRV